MDYSDYVKSAMIEFHKCVDACDDKGIPQTTAALTFMVTLLPAMQRMGWDSEHLMKMASDIIGDHSRKRLH